MDTSKSKKRSRLNDITRHLSKSASELNGHECNVDSPTSSPQRAKSAAATSTGVIAKTHGFFSTLRNKWSRARSRERLGRKSPNDFLESTDYAADYSSENSTPANSPRHRATTLGASSLARENKTISEASINNESFEQEFGNMTDPTSGISRTALEYLAGEEKKRKHESQLRQYVFFQLRIHLKHGSNLVAMDKSGTSDPYVKFKIGGRVLHKSKTISRDLNPIWDEVFFVPIEDPFMPIVIKVFDYDWGLQDDFMGSAKIDLTILELGKCEELTIKLEDDDRPQIDLGEIHLTATLWPRSQEDKELHYQKHQRLSEVSKKLKSQIWNSVVTIVLVKARDLPTQDDGSKLNEAHLKFRLGNEKYKSKTTWSERWLEQFDLHLFDEDQILELQLWNKNICYGRAVLDLSNRARETTHSIWIPFEDCCGEVLLMLTISGTTASETISDLTSYKESPELKQNLKERYQIRRSFTNLRDVGHLTVKVYGANGLAAADLGGKSDPFCVLELTNARLQTQTEYKTLTPNWNKIFTFNVKDITSVLEVTVYDEDRDHKVEFLGKVEVPLLKIKNGAKRWYVLKNKDMVARAKGNNPQILLEMYVVWNPIRAMVQVIQPKEEKLISQDKKFKRQIFLQNFNRFKTIVMNVLAAFRYIQSCFEWESPIRSLIALIMYVLLCLYGTLDTIPAILVCLILKNWFIRWLTGTNRDCFDYDEAFIVDDDDDDDKEKGGEKRSIKEKLHAIQEVSQSVQNTIGYLASVGERTKNTFYFAVPELTWLACISLVAVSIVLHFIPIRILLLIWGLYKFGRRIIRPNIVPNNEVLDFLSRVPDDIEIIHYRELPSNTTDSQRLNMKRKQKPS
ncbi:multiple C2 and transmembrane domain-containing protein isoform X2 [Condylostylus longicornis]|uniref:multiple C2 and transmembrane domain-containing protein isoform X2 n=1 Tax=Condylostylus longicornis TaxID=2530218 RepID=UPI00244E04D7|nr:multiple C2 and transmembrane domain-containing protein isoform X2 [Condylostylus longicornis]